MPPFLSACACSYVAGWCWVWDLTLTPPARSTDWIQKMPTSTQALPDFQNTSSFHKRVYWCSTCIWLLNCTLTLSERFFLSDYNPLLKSNNKRNIFLDYYKKTKKRNNLTVTQIHYLQIASHLQWFDNGILYKNSEWLFAGSLGHKRCHPQRTVCWNPLEWVVFSGKFDSQLFQWAFPGLSK